MIETLRQFWLQYFSNAYNPVEVVFELLLIAIAVHWCAHVLHGTRGTRPLRALLILLIVVTLAVRVLANRFEWARLELLYRSFVLGLGFVALVAFQPELRRAVFRVGELSFWKSGKPQSRLINTLVKSAGFLSKNRFGALIAIERKANLQGYAENGTIMNAELSSNLLNNIFFPNSPLHDLGVIVRGNRVIAANCQFPIADGEEVDASLGSRHLAALAMSYETGAVVLVVSEETGTISIADEGKLVRFLSLDDLSDQLTERLKELDSRPLKRKRAFRPIRDTWRYLRHALLVVGLTLTIWFLADQASLTVYEGAKVQLRLESGAGAKAVTLTEPSPPVFNVTFRGSTRAINQIRTETDNAMISVIRVLDEDLAPGEYTASTRQLLSQTNDLRRRGVSIAAVTPENVVYTVEEMEEIELPIRVVADGIAVDEVKITPPSAQVLIARRELAKIPEDQRFIVAEVTGRLTGKPENEPITLSDVPVRRSVGSARATVAPTDVDVTLRIVGERDRKRITGLSVAFQMSPLIQDRYVVERRDRNEFLIEIDVEGDRAALAALDATAIEAIARIDSNLESESEDFQPVNVEFRLPPGVTIVGPSPTVNVRLIPRPGDLP